MDESQRSWQARSGIRIPASHRPANDHARVREAGKPVLGLEERLSGLTLSRDLVREAGKPVLGLELPFRQTPGGTVLVREAGKPVLGLEHLKMVRAWWNEAL